MPTLHPGEPTRITLELAARSCDVIIGEEILEQLPQLLTEHERIGKRGVLVTDSNVDPLYADSVLDSLHKQGFEIARIVFPAGEASKCMEQITDICRQMLQAGLDRHSFLIALGGGVVGDAAGFAAAIFQRGIPVIQIPTTVVSQVDSSVGGKTGVNTPEGKNLIGSFHQPELVIADVKTLSTLPDREYNEGFGEIIKHAAIRDVTLLDLVEEIGTERKKLTELITRNVAIKAAVVEEDERETSGTRALLNFGHTIGHGIEAAAGYGRLLHGEAISLGLVAAIRLSQQYSTLTEQEAARLIKSLKTCSLPTQLDNDISREDILKILRLDKKFVDGQIRFVLLKSLGNAFVSNKVTFEAIEAAVDDLYGDDDG
ncbi:MAG: 3-dehydroquinate synthase [Verrucomicrobia bacterium]|nr:3-dehydroquinate synthase [Verrucomicrobiota bacterium]